MLSRSTPQWPNKIYFPACGIVDFVLVGPDPQTYRLRRCHASGGHGGRDGGSSMNSKDTAIAAHLLECVCAENTTSIITQQRARTGAELQESKTSTPSENSDVAMILAMTMTIIKSLLVARGRLPSHFSGVGNKMTRREYIILRAACPVLFVNNL